MANSADMSFFVFDSENGMVGISLTMPTGSIVQGPLQILRVVGSRPVSPPSNPMSNEEFGEWRESLEEDGFAVELKFME